MAPKRSVIRMAVQPAAKKAKVMDPVSKNIGIVCDALADTDAEVPCREMLKTAAPMVLQIPCSARHKYEINVTRMVEEVLKARVAKFANILKEATNLVDEAEAAKDAIDSELVGIQRQLEANAAAVSSCRDQWTADSTAAEEAEQLYKAAVQTVVDFEEETRLKKQDLEDCDSAVETMKKDLTALDASDRDAQLLKVSQQLRGASADQSLQSATPLALRKKLEARGTFDVMAIEQAETLLQNHRSVLEERLQGRDDLKANQEAAVDSARAANQTAEEKCKDSVEKLKAAEQNEKTLQAEHKAKEKAVSAQGKELNKVLKQQSMDKNEFDKVNDMLSAFNFLLQRESTDQHVQEEADVSTTAEAQGPLATLQYVRVEA